MKALSFLGTGDYKTVTFVWESSEGLTEVQTRLFPEAVARIFRPDRLLVLITPQVKGHENFRRLQECLGKLVQPIEIPEGKSEAELWDIFARCADYVTEGDEILLDVTHAFRSLPLLVFTVAAYLRRTKDCLLYTSPSPRD